MLRMTILFIQYFIIKLISSKILENKLLIVNVFDRGNKLTLLMDPICFLIINYLVSL
jgi:hypothetical protein